MSRYSPVRDLRCILVEEDCFELAAMLVPTMLEGFEADADVADDMGKYWDGVYKKAIKRCNAQCR